MRKWFRCWEWLKDSDHSWNFGRFVPWQLFLINTIGIIIFAIHKNGFQDFTNVWSAVVGCSGFITGAVVYLIEIFCRERVKIKVNAGSKTFGIESNGKDNG